MRTYKKWTKEEVELLKDLYPRISVKDLSSKFPERCSATIVAKALSLGLPSAKIWQQEENKVIEELFLEAPKERIMELLPKRSWVAIIAQGERLGLKRKRDKPRLEINEQYFTSWNPNMAYILGFILSDGCIIKGSYKGYSDSLKFGVQVKDRDILKKIKRELSAKHQLSISKNAVYLSISSQLIVDSLKKLGVSYRKSLKENVPQVPKDLIRDFIRGIIDGDGSISIDSKDNYPSLKLCGGRDVVTFVRDHFLAKFNVYSKVSERPSRLGGLYEICYRCNSAMKVLDYLYTGAELYLNRKYKLACKCLKLKIKERKKYGASYSGKSD